MAGNTDESALNRRMRSIDDPTAAFPIGALKGIVRSLADAEDAEDAHEAAVLASPPAGVGVVEATWEAEAWDSASSGVSLIFLLLSLVAGAVVAIGVVSVFAVVAFLL